MKTNKFKEIKYFFSIVFWIIIWQIGAMLLNKELFLPTPLKVYQVLTTDLIIHSEFWESILYTLLHIGAGFLLGCFSGILLAVLASMSELTKTLLWFPIKVIQSVPVASFVILILLWIPASGLSVVIPFLMVLPILYTHTLTAITQTDKKLLEMAQVFRINQMKKIRYIYTPAVLPHILSSCSLAIGMAWKSGIAAEIIGLAKNSIGNALYQSKIYLMTPELFAWTIVIVVLSIACEQLLTGFARFLLSEKEETP